MKKKSLINSSLRILTGFIVLYLLSKSINFEESFTLIIKASLIWLILSLGIIYLLRFILTYRWKIILDYQNIKIPFKKLFSINYIATSVGQVLPGGVGGDVVRGYELNKEINQLVNTTSSIVLDRIIGIFSMIILALFATIIAEYIGLKLNFSIYLIILVSVIIFAWLLTPKIKKEIEKRVTFKSLRFKRMFKKILLILESISDKEKIKLLIPKIFFLSIWAQIFRSIMFYFIFLSLGASTDFVYFLVFIPLMLAITIIPISIGGLGVREGTLVYFFGLVGVRPEICVSAGIIFQLLQILFALPGILFWVLQTSKSKKES
jgi:uncharacterized protein (TIRG00374 family)